MQDFALDVFGEAAAYQRDGRFAWAKSGHASDTGKFLGYTFNLFGYYVRGNFQIQLAATSFFSHGTILSSIRDTAMIAPA